MRTTKKVRGRNHANNRTPVEKLLEEIESLKQQVAEHKMALTIARIQIGDKLQELKEIVEHGRWLEVLDQAGFSKRQAQRLMQLAQSSLGLNQAKCGPAFLHNFAES